MKYSDFDNVFQATELTAFGFEAGYEIDLAALASENLHWEAMLFQLCLMGKVEITEELMALDAREGCSGELRGHLEYVISYEYDRWLGTLPLPVPNPPKSVGSVLLRMKDTVWNRQIQMIESKIGALMGDSDLLNILDDMLQLIDEVKQMGDQK